MSDWLIRYARPVLGAAITLIVLGLAGDVLFYLRLSIFVQQALGAVLGLTLAVVFIGSPATTKARPDGKVPAYDVLLAAIGFAGGLYVAVRYPVLSGEFFFRQTETFLVGLVLVPLVVEALRRTAGLGLVVIVVVFLLYGLFADLVPGTLSGRAQPFTELLAYIGTDLNALFGLPLEIITGVVIPFIFLGQLLLHSGGSEWFTDLAIATNGRRRGGSAKIAVIASALFGTISGSAVSNVASTGVLTIPLMKRGGYPASSAGAYEAVASTGGQLMPPIMGAAAFLMSERLGVPYTTIVIAGALPAILYYASIYIQADLEAAKHNIPPIPDDQIKPVGRVLREGAHFAIPFAVLLGALFFLNRRPETAALWAAGTIVLVSLIFGYRGKRVGWRDIVRSITETGIAAVDIVVIGAMAGIIIGTIEITGLSFGLTFLLVQVGQNSLFLLLALTAIVSIVLGMGMPTTAIYLIVATLAAPPLRELGIGAIAADFFVFYYGCLSMITPPVAIAAFTAANLAKANFVPTALKACRYGWPAFVLPFLFVLSPALLLQGSTLLIVHAAGTAVVGVWLASVGLGGFFRRPLDPAGRVVFVLAGIGLVMPAQAFEGALWIEAAGALLAVLAISRELLARRQRLA